MGLIGSPYVSPYRGRQEEQRQREVTMGAEAGGMHSEGGRRGREPRNADGLSKLENARKRLLPQRSQKEHSSANTLILAQVDKAWTYFQPPDYSKIINLYCFMPLSLC